MSDQKRPIANAPSSSSMEPPPAYAVYESTQGSNSSPYAPGPSAHGPSHGPNPVVAFPTHAQHQASQQQYPSQQQYVPQQQYAQPYMPAPAQPTQPMYQQPSLPFQDVAGYPAQPGQKVQLMYQPPAAPPPPMTTTTITITLMPTSNLGPSSATTTCPHCHNIVQTRTVRESGLMTYLASAGICFVGGSLGCCLIPCFMDSFKDTRHYCPACAGVVGVWRRL